MPELARALLHRMPPDERLLMPHLIAARERAEQDRLTDMAEAMGVAAVLATRAELTRLFGGARG